MGLLKNFRRGFATNSSSSHSFVYMKAAQSTSTTPSGQDEFQWNDFRLDTVGDKLFYALADRVGGNWGGFSDEQVQENMERYGPEFPEFDESDFRAAMNSTGVDHESVGTISLEQARDPHVVVFGGNDNDDGSRLRIRAEDEIDWAVTPIGREENNHGTADRVKQKIKDAIRAAAASFPTATPKPAAKFHIGRDGGVKSCRATKRACPYAAEDHFASQSDAEAALEQRYNG